MYSFIPTLIYLTTAWILRKIYNIRASIHPSLNELPKATYIIISDHYKRIDPYVILAALPYTAFTKLLPIRFMTANIYLQHWWQRALLQPQGCFPAYPVKGEISGLLGCLELIQKGNTLMIFPQGERVKEDREQKIFEGIAFLAKTSPVAFIPVKLHYAEKTFVTWGKPFTVGEKDVALPRKELTDYIFSKVANLD